MRVSKRRYYLNIAREVSTRSTCLKRQYGAVIVNANDEIISTGYNGSARGEENCCDRGTCYRAKSKLDDYSDCCSVHAEQNAIRSAARRDMKGGTIYLTGQEDGKICGHVAPCPICDRMIKNAGLTVVRYEDLEADE